jgi:hypothetical protein
MFFMMASLSTVVDFADGRACFAFSDATSALGAFAFANLGELPVLSFLVWVVVK